jgi:segregation and condensation protein A
MPNAPTVKTPIYEGPLDLLLDLIEKRKLLINDISLAEVTDEYIARINTMEEMPVGETTEFVSLAATLLLIKSRSLLPTLSITGEEVKDIKELEYRLAVYQLFKESAKTLGAATVRPYLFEGNAPEPEPLFIFDTSISFDSLRVAAQSLRRISHNLGTAESSSQKNTLARGGDRTAREPRLDRDPTFV